MIVPSLTCVRYYCVIYTYILRAIRTHKRIFCQVMSCCGRLTLHRPDYSNDCTPTACEAWLLVAICTRSSIAYNAGVLCSCVCWCSSSHGDCKTRKMMSLQHMYYSEWDHPPRHLCHTPTNKSA